ncbi:unnamed protein product [Durusdinium trenchii]|uniref:Uncharacterized protein n=1 Tax=Durusdinium trenchii TaxID=1381693 RepID=A0ABP0HJE9_9DINO
MNPEPQRVLSKIHQNPITRTPLIQQLDCSRQRTWCMPNAPNVSICSLDGHYMKQMKKELTKISSAAYANANAGCFWPSGAAFGVRKTTLHPTAQNTKPVVSFFTRMLSQMYRCAWYSA